MKDKAPTEVYHLLPGTQWGLKKFKGGLALAKLEEKKHKDSPPTWEYGEAVYPVDWRHAANIIARECGEGTASQIMNAIVGEQKKLAAIVYDGIVKEMGGEHHEAE